MIALMALNRETLNTELKSRYGLEVKKPAREKLNREGLVQSRRVRGKGFVHELPDDGWAWWAGGQRVARTASVRRRLHLAGALAVTPEAPGQLDSLECRQIQIADLFEQLRGRGPGQRFRQRVAPLPVLSDAAQSVSSSTTPSIPATPGVSAPRRSTVVAAISGPPAGGTRAGIRRPCAAPGNVPAAPRWSAPQVNPAPLRNGGESGRPSDRGASVVTGPPLGRRHRSTSGSPAPHFGQSNAGRHDSPASTGGGGAGSLDAVAHAAADRRRDPRANAAMRSIERRDTGESHEAFIRRLAEASGVETPTRAELARFDRSRKNKKTSNSPGRLGTNPGIPCASNGAAVW